MKKLLLFVLLASFSFGYGQNLSLSQLMSLRTMELDDVELYLTQRGWSYKDGEQESEDSLGSVNFVYGTSGDFGFGIAFISRIFSSDGTDRIAMQISKREKYLEYLKGVKNFKPQLVYSGTEDGDLVKVYQGATTTFIFTTSTANNVYGDTKSSWRLTIRSNEDY